MKKMHVELHPDLTQKQREIIRSKSEHLIIKGPAGTSKTYTALARGLIQLSRGDVEKIVIIRSPVEIRKIGLLPGDIDEKVEEYAAPYIDVLTDLSPKVSYKALIQQKLIDFMPTTFLRGRTFKNSYIIADEFQNFSAHEFETIITRIGEGSNLVLVGDDQGQSDLMAYEAGQFKSILRIAEYMPEFRLYEFGVEDIVRSGLVRSYYIAKQRLETPQLRMLNN